MFDNLLLGWAYPRGKEWSEPINRACRRVSESGIRDQLAFWDIKPRQCNNVKKLLFLL